MVRNHKKIALITGASMGIGASTAIAMAEAGYTICINYKSSKQAAKELEKKITSNGGEAFTFKADISNEDEILSMFQFVDKTLGDISVLINNAGHDGGRHRIEGVTVDILKEVFETNVFGTILCSREAIKRMKSSGGGEIINISSEAATTGGRNLSHYAASKAAINSFAISLARELEGSNIRINTISPGLISTESQKDAVNNRNNPENIKTPEEVASLIIDVLTNKDVYKTGDIIAIG